VAIRPRQRRRSSARRQHGGDGAADPGRGPAALCAHRAVDGRLCRFRDHAARGEAPERTEQRKPLIALAKSGRFAEILESQYPTLVHRSRHNDAALKATVRAMNEETGADAYLRQQQAIMTRVDSRPSLAAIKCPTLVLVGDSDEATPPDLAREMAAAIPGAKLVVIPECGHLSTIERPQAVNKALVELMQSR
jgi:pimeloyl-ACP methyl ester carboxylesterase